MVTKDFVVAGTCGDNLYGMCESLWEPDLVCNDDQSFVLGLARCHARCPAIVTRFIHATLRVALQEPEDLFETISQALMNAVDRDAVSGWGAIVHIMYATKGGCKVSVKKVGEVETDKLTLYWLAASSPMVLLARDVKRGARSQRCSEKDKITTRTLKTRMD
jgi:20S proteasome alpha/beta subunit